MDPWEDALEDELEPLAGFAGRMVFTREGRIRDCLTVLDLSESMEPRRFSKDGSDLLGAPPFCGLFREGLELALERGRVCFLLPFDLSPARLKGELWRG